MQTKSLSSVTSKFEDNKKLKQKLFALEIDYKIFQDSKTGLRSRRFSIEGQNPITRLLEKSPRTLMSSLQNTGSFEEKERKKESPFKGRSLFRDFEDAVEVHGSYNDEKIEDCGSGKQGIGDGSCSSSCLSEEKFGEWMSEKMGRDECRRGLAFNGLVVIGLIGIILGIIFIMSYGVYGDEELMLLPT